jgi:hypothetical protein
MARTVRKVMFLCGSRWHLNYMRVGAPYLTLKNGFRTARPVRSAAVDVLSPIGLIQDLRQDIRSIDPGQQLGKAQFIEWQEAIGHE